MADMNKTEKATPKKKRDERKKGNVYQSKDVVSITVILVGFFLLSKLGLFIATQISNLYAEQIYRMENLHQLTIAGCMQIIRDMIRVFFISSFPVILALAITGIVMTGVQTGFLVSSDLLKFKASRISIMQGFKRMFSLRSVVQLVISLIKVFVIMWIIYSSVKKLLFVTPDLLTYNVNEGVLFTAQNIMSMIYKICILFIGVAVLDYAYQRFDYEKKLRMSKQEIKDEYKQTEGDPFIKGKIKERQRKMSMNRMMQQVADADVIVRNPTHYAIALKYDIDKDPAPIVLAKGQGDLAKRIIAEGEKHRVLITENRPLAKSLYDAVQLNEYIPAQFYQAVAEVMAWVYGNKDKGQETT